MKQSSPYKIYFLMFLATFFWAGAFIAAKLGVYDLSPVLLTFLRMGLAAVILFPILVFKQSQSWQLELSELKYVLATAIVGMIGYHLFFFSALKYTTASNASMINATNPLITALLATYFAGEKLSLKKVLLLLMALTGVLYIITKGNLFSILSLDFNKGDFIMLCGTILWAVYGILVKKIVPIMGPLKLTTYSFLFCAVILLPFATYDFIKTQAYLVGGIPLFSRHLYGNLSHCHWLFDSTTCHSRNRSIKSFFIYQLCTNTLHYFSSSIFRRIHLHLPLYWCCIDYSCGYTLQSQLRLKKAD